MRRALCPPHLLKHFDTCLEGLTEVRIHVNARHTAHGKEKGREIQRFYLAEGARRPTADTLCRMTWLRGEMDVRQHGCRTQFRVHLMGVVEGEEFNHQGLFTIKEHEILKITDPHERHQEVDERDRVDEDEDEDGDEEGDGDDEDGDEDEDGEEDEEDEEDDNDLPYEDEVEDEEDDWASGPPAMISHPVTIEPATKERHLVPQTINPEFIAHTQKATLNLAHRAYSAPMRENRRLVHDMRSEMSEWMKEMKNMSDALVKQAIDLNNKAEERSNAVIEFLSERLKAAETERAENASLWKEHWSEHSKNMQELAKQGWTAMLDAAAMKQEVVDDRVQWAKWLEQQARDTPAPIPEIAPSNGSGGFGEIFQQASRSPVLIAGLAMLARKMGNIPGAVFLENLAKTAAAGADEDDDDEYEDVHDVEAHERQPRNGSDPFVGQQAGPSAAPPSPFAARIRKFRHGLAPEKLAKMQELLPDPAWQAFEAASGAPDDASAAAAVGTMSGFIESDFGLMGQLMEHLDEDEVGEIMEAVQEAKKIRKRTQRRAPPRRPPPRPQPPTAE
ncbi:MAG: hypothetical protein K0U16_07200 [Gammaproteobacteria bacterium]|nr:hypothetical protein [Gammaproteobacteria bacterium]